MVDSKVAPLDREELELYLRRKLRGRISNLHLQAHEGGLILRGDCTSYHSKQLAQHALMKATDRPLIANRIEVRYEND